MALHELPTWEAGQYPHIEILWMGTFPVKNYCWLPPALTQVPHTGRNLKPWYSQLVSSYLEFVACQLCTAGLLPLSRVYDSGSSRYKKF